MKKIEVGDLVICENIYITLPDMYVIRKCNESHYDAHICDSYFLSDSTETVKITFEYLNRSNFKVNSTFKDYFKKRFL